MAVQPVPVLSGRIVRGIGWRYALTCAIFVLLGAVSTLAAQTPSQPVIRVTTRLVEVDVVARDRRGLVADLTKDDFTILDNGKPQKVAFFEKRMRGGAAGLPAAGQGREASGAANRAVPPAGAALTSTVVVLDTRHADAATQYRTKDDVLKFMRQIAAGERVAIFSLGGMVQLEQDFTGNPALLAAAVDRGRWGSGFQWSKAKQETEAAALRDNAAANADLARLVRAVGARFITNNPPLTDNPAKSIAPLVAGTCIQMIALAKYLGGIPGRKNVLWVSGAFPLAVLGDSPLLFTDELSQVNHAFTDANAALYPVDVRGLVLDESLLFRAPLPGGRAPRTSTAAIVPATGGPAEPARPSFAGPTGLETMNDVAHFTGGVAFYNGSDIAKEMRAAADDAGITYVLGFYPDPGTLDSRRHVLKVKTARKDVELRYRMGYTASADDPATRLPEKAQIAEALWSPLDRDGIPLAAKTEKADGTAPGLLRIVLSIGGSELGLRREGNNWSGELALQYAERSADSRDLGSITETVHLQYDELHYRSLAQDGVTYPRLVRPAPDAARIRVVVYDRISGRLGSVTVALR
jgi:VWFA-related protein